MSSTISSFRVSGTRLLMAHFPSAKKPALPSLKPVQKTPLKIPGSTQGRPHVLNKNCQSYPTLRQSDFLQSDFLVSKEQTVRQPVKTRPLTTLRAPQQNEIPNIASISQKLAEYYRKNLSIGISQIQEILGRHGEITGRAKSALSIKSKLLRKSCLDITDAKKVIRDGIGTRLILPTGTPKEVDAVVKSLCTAIENGSLTIKRITNYQGVNSYPYLQKSHIDSLKASIEKRQQLLVQKPAFSNPVEALKIKELEIKTDNSAILSSGYTAAQFNIETKHMGAELQIRGPEVDHLAQLEHLIYDIRNQKMPIRKYRDSEKNNMQRLQSTLNHLPEAEYDAYLKYISACYRNARKRELGLAEAFYPELPATLKAYPHLALSTMQK